uniref:histidine kinase n=1 Tax=Fundidesulfovibrio putealis TaxID=270496 RepID=A0A7C4EK59_9BACT
MLNRLSVRLTLPVVVGVLALWGFLTIFVLAAIERMAEDSATKTLTSYARELGEILDDAYDHLAQSGTLADQGEVRIAKARALGKLDKHLRMTDARGLVLGEGGAVLLATGLDPAARLPETPADGRSVARVSLDGRDVYLLRMDFPIWGWKLVLVESTHDMAMLAGSVRNLYLGGGLLLALGMAGYLYTTRRVVGRPVTLINRALKRGERPDYTGVEEFASLSASIREMMDSLDERERLLRQSRTWYRQMFESAPVMLFSLDMEGRFADVNTRFCRHTGHTRPQVLGTPAARVFLPDQVPLDDLLAGAPVSHRPARMLTASGQERNVLLDALPARSPAGDRALLVVVMDVTDQLRAERALIAAKDAAEEANRVKSEFLANLSHEIRTPLNGLLGMLQLLEKSPMEARQKGWVNNSLDCGRALLTLLGDILDFSTLEAGRATLSSQPFSPAAILEEVAQIHARQALANGVAMAVDVDPDLEPAYLGDGGRLRQTLFNLAGNAVKFTTGGTVTLRVQTAGRAPSGDPQLLFSVEDTGIGIAEEKLLTVFEPFTQADGSHTRRYQGAGLGLAVVKRLVRLWGGTLMIDSEPGQGTAVHFTMPVRPATSAARQRAVAVQEDAPPPGRRVLLAEDDPINTVMTMDMLESLGYSATIVDNGADALKALSQEDFDCMIMDIQMPRMDGLAATQAIRSKPDLGEKSRIPIIALTAHAMPGDRERFLAAGMDDYLAKPVEYAHLAGVLSRAMGKPWRRRLS